MIDYTIIYFYNFSRLYNYISNNIEEILKLYDEKNKFSKGVIFLIEKRYRLEFDSLSSREEKISYLNSDRFLGNLQGYSFIIYDEKKCIAEIYRIYILNSLKTKAIYTSIFDSLLKYIPSIPEGNRDDKPCRIYLMLSDIMEKIISFRFLSSLGFYGTYANKKSPLGISLGLTSIFLIKNNTPMVISSPHMGKILANKVGFIKRFKLNQLCKLNFILSNSSKKFLREMTKNSGTVIFGMKDDKEGKKDGKEGNMKKQSNQKEVSGGFCIGNIHKTKGGIIFEFNIDKKLVRIDKDEEAQIAPSKYNFHTHPFQAYINNNVDYAWPSAADFNAFLYSVNEYGTIFHILGSVEGIYVISLSKDICNKNGEIPSLPKTYFKKFNLNDKRKDGKKKSKNTLRDTLKDTIHKDKKDKSNKDTPNKDRKISRGNSTPEIPVRSVSFEESIDPRSDFFLNASFNPQSYTTYINSEEFRVNGKKIFDVQYCPWSEDYIFEVYFPKQNDVCLV